MADGEAFRLVPREFYYQLNQFSTPEMRRCPLDKLILQIKMWNYKEPKALLGASIEPPQLADVELAIRRLQDAGAVTVPTKERPSGEITFLGRIYCDMPCDIRTTRLCIFGLLFGCMKQTIVMAAIIQQDKSLFQESQSSIDPVRLRVKFDFAGETDSDLMAYYRAYTDWHRTFVAEQEKCNPGFYRRRFFSSRGEVGWCRDRGLNLCTLKEAYRLAAELRERFIGFGVSPALVDMDIASPAGPGEAKIPAAERLLLVKLAIAGAFYPRYMRPQHGDIKMLRQEEQKRTADGVQRPHAITLLETKGVPKGVIEAYFGQFGKIEKLEQRENSFVLEYVAAGERKGILSVCSRVNSNYAGAQSPGESCSAGVLRHFASYRVPDQELLLPPPCQSLQPLPGRLH